MFPGSVFIIGSFYTQWETARRVSLFYMAALLASGFGSIVGLYCSPTEHRVDAVLVCLRIVFD